MLKDTKFWAGYIVVFALVTFFVTGLLELAEWTARLLNHTVNPLFLTAGGICAFITILKMYDK